MELNTKGTVLVVEDDPGIAPMLERFLSKKGYSICVAITGEDAIKKYDELQEKKTPIHKILLDNELNKYSPSITGLQIFEQLKQKYNLSADYIRDKIIFTSSNVIKDDAGVIKDNDISEQAKKLGIQSFQPKPFNLELLLKEIQNIPICSAPVEIETENGKCDYASATQPPQTI